MQQKTSWNKINHAKCVDIGLLYLGVVNASNKTVLEINTKGLLGNFIALTNNMEYQHTRTIFALACHRALCHLFIGGFSDIRIPWLLSWEAVSIAGVLSRGFLL